MRINRGLRTWMPHALLGIFVAAAIVFLVAGCGTQPGGEQQISSKSASAVLTGKSQARASAGAESDVPLVAASSNAFAFDLFGAIRPKDGNFVCSPYGVAAVLSMTMAGARGETEEEFARVLHLDLPKERLYPALGALDLSLADIEDFTSASSLWGQTGQPYEKAFVDLLGQTYGAPLRLVDFGNYSAAARTINRWVSDATKGRIQKAVSPDGPRPDVIVLMLTNAVYMKAKWLKPFLPSQTIDSSFHLLDGSTVQVPTMQETEELRYLSDPTLQAAELPYADGRLSLVVILPEEGRFAEVGQELSTERLDQLLAAMTNRKVALQLPRFTFSSSSDLVQVLQDLGIKAAFSSRADFSGMSRLGSQISGVGQEAFIVVDEEGTEAAASATVTMAAGISMDGIFFPVDRPFYYLVRDEQTGVIVFLGQVADPRGEEQPPVSK
jgi:serpin B